ncbi:MAG: triose-phosphate isomerase, partial [Gammaproteobacteria bacterium]|nr:triose-phosphate isomerase [Gammaproteobacteria bacterium]
MRRRIVAGNWKMNGTQSDASALVRAISVDLNRDSAVQVVLCPPFILIPTVATLLTGQQGIEYGGQNLDVHDHGAYTGEISAPMLRDFGCRYVIVGHSERRALYGDTDDLVAAKSRKALDSGLTPIVCVGESLRQREQNTTESVVGAQLDAVVAGVGSARCAEIVVAYEPVWAIGTGRSATPVQAQSVHRFIRDRLAAANDARAADIPILYGGSVKPDNASALFAEPDIDGGLIGG